MPLPFYRKLAAGGITLSIDETAARTGGAASLAGEVVGNSGAYGRPQIGSTARLRVLFTIIAMPV
jgi:hypothetical protein